MSVSADPQIVHDPVFRHRLRFQDTTDEHGNPAVLCEMWVDPGGGVPPHAHPRMEERFTVVEGRMEFLAGRRWVARDAGETAVVPAGTRHAYRNRGSVVAYSRCIATPPTRRSPASSPTPPRSRATAASRSWGSRRASPAGCRPP